MHVSIPSSSSEQFFESRNIVIHSISSEFKFLQIPISSFGFRGVPKSVSEVGNKFRPEAFIIVSVCWLKWGVPSWIPVYLPIHLVNLLSHPVIDVGPLDVG